MRLKNVKTRKSAEITEPIVKGKITITEVSGMEQKIAEKTRELRNTAQQIRELSDAAFTFDEEDRIDEIRGPHGPMIELHIDPDDQMIDPDVESEIKDTVELAEDESKNIKINSPVKATGISSDVSARDLLKEIKEIENIIRERQRG